MSKLIVIGEALIDWIPDIKGVELKSVTGFKRVAGGAPANVAGACAKLRRPCLAVSLMMLLVNI